MLLIFVHTYIFYLFAQKVTIDPWLVPKVGMTFSGVDEAYQFYSRYAYEVGFPLKKYKWLNCSMEGKSAVRGISNPKVRNTSSKRTQCKASMKLKKIYDDAKEIVISVCINLLHLNHNHEFFKKDTEKNQLQCNKTHDPEYMEFISSMQESRISQHCIMDYVSEMHGGPESVPVTTHHMYNL
jgi:hypothetical protein